MDSEMAASEESPVMSQLSVVDEDACDEELMATQLLNSPLPSIEDNLADEDTGDEELMATQLLDVPSPSMDNIPSSTSRRESAGECCPDPDDDSLIALQSGHCFK